MAIRWRIAILLAVITTINYIDRSVFGVVAPVVRGEFGINDADYGLITSGFLLAYGIGQLISGPLIDRLGTKRAFSYAAIFWSVATILHALGRGLWSFFTLRIILGLAEAANFPAASKAVAQWFPANERSTAVAIFMLGAGLGAIITPPLTVWTMQSLGWQWAFIIPGSMGLVWVVLWQRWYHPPEAHPSIEPAEQALILENRSGQQSRGVGVRYCRIESSGASSSPVLSVTSPFTSSYSGCRNISLMSGASIFARSLYLRGCPGLPLTSARSLVAP